MRFFPAWYLPKGTKTASENELENASSSCEGWGLWCGVFVILSVAAELIIAWYDPPYDTFLKLSIWPDAVIGVGIIGEVLFGMRNSRIQTELRDRSNHKLAVAEKDAADARLEAERLKAQLAWRALATHQNKLIEALEKNPGIVLIEYVSADPDSSLLARQFGIVFRHSRWTASLRACMYTAAELAFGIIVSESDSEPDSAPHNSSITGALKAADIDFRIDSIPEWFASTDDEAYESDRGPTARMFIGPKEPVFEPIRKTAAAK